MIKTIVGILFIVLSVNVIQAQTVSIGTGFGVDILIFDKSIDGGVNIIFLSNFSFSKLLEAEIRPGIQMASDFRGYDLGGYLKIFPLENPFFLILGLKLHANKEEGRTGTGTRGDLYLLPTLGLGHKLKLQQTMLNFEILYQKPYPNGLTYYIIGDQYHYSDDFNGILSFNFGICWQL